MRYLRLILIVIGFVCTVVFFSANARYRSTPDGEHFTLGIGFDPSPWFRYEREPSRTFTGVVFASWSWLFGAAAVASFWGAGRVSSAPVPARERADVA